MTDLQDKVFKFLDRHYPINRIGGNIITLSYNENIVDVIHDVFGTREVKFNDWIEHHCRSGYCLKFSGKRRGWYNMKHQLHRNRGRAAHIDDWGNKSYFKNGWRVEEVEAKKLKYNSRHQLVRKFQ